MKATTTTTMQWTRERDDDGDVSGYRSGPYLVAKVYAPEPPWSIWHATGPGIEDQFDRLADAKAACERIAQWRAESPADAEIVVGDRVLILVGLVRRAGTVSAVLPGEREPTYVVKLPRGRRRCAYRAELTLVPA